MTTVLFTISFSISFVLLLLILVNRQKIKTLENDSLKEFELVAKNLEIIQRNVEIVYKVIGEKQKETISSPLSLKEEYQKAIDEERYEDAKLLKKQIDDTKR